MKSWISFRAPANLARQLRDEAKERGATLTAVIVERLGGEEKAAGDDVRPLQASEPPGCPHPKDRIRNIARGKLCLDCHTELM